ncbi:MAG: peptidase MA family metallohydrolase [Calditrichia bacterium]
MNWYKVFLIYIFVGLLSSGNASADSGKVELRHENFKVVYAREDEYRALNIIKELQKHSPVCQNFFGAELQGLITIYLPSSKAEFTYLAGQKLPDWSAAVYVSSMKRIVLKRPEWTLTDTPLEKDLAHELSHVYLDERLGAQKVPLWFNEGIAEYLSGQRINIAEGVTLSNALFTKRITQLASIDSLLSFPASRARLAYLQSLSVILFLNSRYLQNQASWNRFMEAISAGTFDAALQNLTGMDKIDFEIKWYRWLQEKYRWFVIFNLENLIWVAMVVVLIGALYAIRYRNRRRLEQWEQEEPAYGSYESLEFLNFSQNEDEIEDKDEREM